LLGFLLLLSLPLLFAPSRIFFVFPSPFFALSLRFLLAFGLRFFFCGPSFLSPSRILSSSLSLILLAFFCSILLRITASYRSGINTNRGDLCRQYARRDENEQVDYKQK
jgi:hypothetical protein